MRLQVSDLAHFLAKLQDQNVRATLRLRRQIPSSVFKHRAKCP